MARDAVQAAVVIVAAGRGARAGGVGQPPKQYRSLAGEAVLTRTLRAFLDNAHLGPVVVVIHPDDRALFENSAAGLGGTPLLPTTGGATRAASVLAGLEALASMCPRHVLIHDAARPFVSRALIGRVLDTLAGCEGAIAAMPVADTLKKAAPDGRIAATLDRNGLFAAQTPQGFAFEAILAAHRKAAAAGRSDFTDDASIAEWAGLKVTLVEGSARNRKLTTEEDLRMAEEELLARGPAGLRVGHGFDVHRLGPGSHVWLGGVEIPHAGALIGHSDADVALHALTDALLGAIADGDIGQHFPPSDARWQGAPSTVFLADAARRVESRGGRILNVDLTILCEAPRIAPHRSAMQARIAGVLKLAPDQVSVKATTTEGLGFTGRREGIAAQATATILLKHP